MWDNKLFLLLLLSTCVVAEPDNSEEDQEEPSRCPLGARLKHFRKYVYQYTADSRNGVSGTANLRNGPKISCKVEVEVPQMCNFILSTTECSLSEVSVIDPQGQPVYRQAARSEDFQAAMEKNPLHFTVKQVTQVSIYPERDEPEVIVDIKRGIISALLAPVMEEEHNRKMSTIHGVCKTDLTVNSKKDIDTDVTVVRDLSECSHFQPQKLPSSPLSLSPLGLNGLLSKLIRSSQECNYQFDNRRKHMTSAQCTEKHIFLPFSHKSQYGISSVVTQTLTLLDSVKTNSRYFHTEDYLQRNLHRSDGEREVEDKLPVQSKENVLAALRDLKGLAGTERKGQGSSIFQKLVSEVKGLKNDTLSALIPHMLAETNVVTWQVLLQCGTRECSSALLQILRTYDRSNLVVDPVAYIIGLLQHSGHQQVKDMLSMAQFKQSRAIMYALAHTVKNHPDDMEAGLTQEVADFMEFLIGDCSGDEDSTFQTLRVVGVMGKHLQHVPSLRSTVLNCMRQPSASQSVQKAALQAFRLMDIKNQPEIVEAVLQIFQDEGEPVEKRVAAYLLLMGNGQVMDHVKRTLTTSVQNEQVKSFVASHVANVVASKDNRLQGLKNYIKDLGSYESPSATDFTTFSNNYKLEVPDVMSLQRNTIFNSEGNMPKELMLEMVLMATQILEIGLEGEGLEKTLEVLLGKDGVFFDTVALAMQWIEDNMPQEVSRVLKHWLGPLRGTRMKREALDHLLNNIRRKLLKLGRALSSKNVPDILAYLRVKGVELGYIKTSEIKQTVEATFAALSVFTWDGVCPHSANSGADQKNRVDCEWFGHYIFLDNAFALPTTSGFPLKFSLSGVFNPSEKVDIELDNGELQISYFPSFDVNFVTQMGIHIPEYVVARTEMHTNLYHERSFNLKISVLDAQLKFEVPVLPGSTQLFSISNKVLSVSSTQTRLVPSMVEDRTDVTQCLPIFAGMKICTILRYSNASSTDNAPYYPLTGETRFAVELQPTGQVTGYTATVSSVDVNDITIKLKAEGASETETTILLKLDKESDILTADIQVSDYFIKAAIKTVTTDMSRSDDRMLRSISIDVANKNMPQLTLTGRARLESMRDGMLQFEMALPALNVDATATATLKTSDRLVMQLETAIKIPETTSLQKVTIRYDEDKVEVELKSDVNSEIKKLIPNIEDYRIQLQTAIDDILDQKVAKTDMKLRHIVSKGFEAVNIWLDRFTTGTPSVEVQRNKRGISELTLPSVPEKLFLNSDALFRYQFNKGKIFVSLPLVFSGKSSQDFSIPVTLSIPEINLPRIGLVTAAKKFRLPSFTIPRSLDFSLPLIGLGELSGKVNSNFYDWEGSISGGNNTIDVPSYIAKCKVVASCPLPLLSYKTEATGMISGTYDDNLKYIINGSLKHSLLDASFSVFETMTVNEKVSARANSKVEVSGPLGLHASVHYSAQSASNDDEVNGDGNLDGVIKVGSLFATTTYVQSYIINLRKSEGKGESTFKLDSSVLKAENMFQGTYADGELFFLSKTDLMDDLVTHVAELRLGNAKLSLKSDATATALSKVVRCKAEAGISREGGNLRIESQADDSTNRAYSILTASLNQNGLEGNVEGSLHFYDSRGSHKGTLTLGVNGLATSCTTTIQCNSLTFENILTSGIDSNGASLSIMSKGLSLDNRAELSVEGKLSCTEAYLNSVFKGNAFEGDTRNAMNLKLDEQGLKFSNTMTGSLQKMKTENTHTLTLSLGTLDFESKIDCTICDGGSYNHDMKVNMRPFVVSVSATNDLELFDIKLGKEGTLKLEPLKMDLSGIFTGSYGEDNHFKHSYVINYADLAGTLKCDTTANILDTQLNHNLELEFAGLSSKMNSEAHVNSKALRLQSTVRTMALPFSLSVDAILNSDGELNFYGKHTGQLYSKYLLKAEPFAIAEALDCRASATHVLPDGESAETHLENKFDGLLIPNEQSAYWKLKSKLNNHAYNQDVNLYNTEEKIGIELAGVLKTNLFNKAVEYSDISLDNQEFSISGSVKYDKSSDFHIIDLPFIESLPVAFEHLKSAIVDVLESLQAHINNLDIDAFINRFRIDLDEFPSKIHDLIEEMDLENKVNRAKERMIYLLKHYAFTFEDLELAVENLKTATEKTITDMATKIRDLMVKIRDFIQTGSWTDAVSNILTQIGDGLKDFDERNKITKNIIWAIAAVEDIIRQIDLQKLQDSSLAWLKNLDAQYGIRAKLQQKVRELKEVFENFDIMVLVHDLRDYIVSFDPSEIMDQVSDQIPTEDIERVLDNMKDIIVNWIEEYEIADKFNSLYFVTKDLFEQYEVEKKIEVFVEQAIALVKQYRVQEAVQYMVDAIKSIKFEYIFDQVMDFLDSVVGTLKSIDFKQSIDDLNNYISTTVQSLKYFNYDAFLDDTNQNIRDITNKFNDQIQLYEIPQKIEASREFLRGLQASVVNYIEQLKNTKIAEIFKMAEDVINTTAYKDIKFKVQEMLEDFKQRVRDMDIKDEIAVYLHRVSESYINMIAYISSQFNGLIDEIRKVAEDHEILNLINETVQSVLKALQAAEIEISAFVLPLTDLHIPSVKISMQKLHEIDIPTAITVPEFTVLGSLTVPTLTIDLEEIKQWVITFVDYIHGIEIPAMDPEAMFGDLKALYLCDLPDLTFSEVTLSDFKFPAINIPKLDIADFQITMLSIPDIKLPKIPSDVHIPAFGKLYGEFRVTSPHYTLMTVATLENSTVTPQIPSFKATLSSHAKSTLEFLDYSLDATVEIEAQQKRQFLIVDTIKTNHMAFTIDHEGSLTLSGPIAEALSKTTAKATTNMYTAELFSVAGIALENGISATMETNYNHNVNIPSADISCQSSLKQMAKGLFESGTISFTVDTTGNGKWSIKDYSDEGTHKSNLGFSISTGTAKFTFTGNTDSKALKMRKSINAESVILSHFTLDVHTETETPFIKTSVMTLTGRAKMEDLTADLSVVHDAELIGRASGTISNACEFLAQPFEIILDCKNKGNSKILFPLKLTGKIDMQNDYGLTLKPDVQRASWVGLARFNQYKYSHNFTLDNNERTAGIYASVDGEANLDFLTIPLSIPEMTVPYVDMKTPEVKDLSLWDNLGLNYLLTTPRQSFDMDFKLQYHKNPDVHIFAFDLKPLYKAINENANIISAHFERKRDIMFDFLTKSYNHARTQFQKHKIDTSHQPPRIFRVPGYTVPFLDIEVSAFSAELPAFSYVVPKEVSTPSYKIPFMGFSIPSYTLVLPSFGLPVLHVPETLKELTLPTFTLPEVQDNIKIPALGNITYDFTFKSAMINVNVNWDLHNQSDIVTKFGASSTSVFEFLRGKIDGTTSISKKRGLKLATALSLEHMNSECSHDSTVSLTKRNMEASVTTNCKVTLPILNLELNQELLGNSKTKPNVASKTKLKYTFHLPLIEATGNGNIDHNLAVEALTSYFSLENSLLGKTDGTIKDSGTFAGTLNNEASIYLNVNGFRSTVKTDLSSKADYEKSNIWDVTMNENLALEASLRRVYAEMNYECNNEANLHYFTTNGKHTVEATLEFVPLTTLSAKMKMDVSQPSSLGHVSILNDATVTVTTEKQKFVWSGTEQLASIIHFCELMMSNDEDEIRIEMTESWQGYLDFLRSLKFPVYQKTLWDVLKFDQTTSPDKLQFLNASAVVVYTKNKDGIYFTLPAKVFENGVTFSIPEIKLAVPEWVKEIPKTIKELDARFENELSDYVSIPPVITLPDFHFPFTNLHIPSISIDPQNLEIPKVVSTASFDILLPGLPKVEIPSFNIDTMYIKDKMSFLSVMLPKYEITISSFTLPKIFPIGDYTIDVDEITNKIYHFEMPAITVPEQKIDIPEMSVYLPASLFIPSFGALSTTLKVSSPIYNHTWTAKMENKDPDCVLSIKSSCTSTMVFLEYDLDASSIMRLENGAINVDGKCTLTHNDFSINCKHDLQQNMRMKREEPSGSSASRHTLDVDLTSQTFADVSFRFASQNNGITSSVSSPSTGFIGFQFTRRSPSQFYGKLFSRYLATPDKDTDLLSFKATLRNSEKLSLQMGWYMNGLSDMVHGVTARIPAITSALHKVIDKYHSDHFGMDLNRAGLQLKNTISNTIDRAYDGVPWVMDSMKNSLEQLSQKSKDMLRKTADEMPLIDAQELISKVSSKVKEFLELYDKNSKVVLDAIMTFLSESNFHLPGMEEKMSGQELFQKMKRSIAKAINRAVQRFTILTDSIIDTVASFINDIEITIPGTNTVISGKEILESLKSTLKSVQDQITQAVKKWERMKLEKVLKGLSDLLKLCIQKVEEFLSSLKAEGLDEISNHIDSIYNDVNNSPFMQRINTEIEQLKYNVAEYKDGAKIKVQDIYNRINKEQMNTDLAEFIMELDNPVYGILNEILEFMKTVSQTTQPYLKVSSKKMDVEIPLPFYWKTFSEWPSLA